MGVYADSSPDAFDDPKVETVVEILHRVWGSAIGVVTTAYMGDATPMALTGHSRTRAAYGPLIDQQLRGVTNYTWTDFDGPDVVFGGGAEQFLPNPASYQGKDYYEEFAKAGYSVSLNKTSLADAPTDQKALGIFSISNLPVWLDRNVYTQNLEDQANSPTGDETDATDLPGLKEMTLKAVDILHKRGGRKGFFLMSEGASIDKQMHALDYDRALGDLLELDDTVKATVAKLKDLRILRDTLIIVTADHGHGFGECFAPIIPGAGIRRRGSLTGARCVWLRGYQIPERANDRPTEAQRYRVVSKQRPVPVHGARIGRRPHRQ